MIVDSTPSFILGYNKLYSKIHTHVYRCTSDLSFLLSVSFLLLIYVETFYPRYVYKPSIIILFPMAIGHRLRISPASFLCNRDVYAYHVNPAAAICSVDWCSCLRVIIVDGIDHGLSLYASCEQGPQKVSCQASILIPMINGQ